MEGGSSITGVYCAGFVCLYIREMEGIDIPDPASQSPKEVMASPFASYFERVTGKPKVGDVAIMPGEYDIDKGHIGIFINKGVLHASRGNGVIWQPLGRAGLSVTAYYRLRDEFRK